MKLLKGYALSTLAQADTKQLTDWKNCLFSSCNHIKCEHFQSGIMGALEAAEWIPILQVSRSEFNLSCSCAIEKSS